MLTALDPSPKAISDRLDFARKLVQSSLPERQKGALEKWIETAGQGGVSRQDMRPAMFGRTLQFVALVEVLDDGTDYRHLIEGREVIRWFGNSGKERFSTLYAADYLARLRSFYLTVQLTGRPNRRHFMAHSIDEEELAFSQLVLPATDEQGIIRFLAVVFDFSDPLRRIPDAPLKIFAPWRRLQKGTGADTIMGDYKWR